MSRLSHDTSNSTTAIWAGAASVAFFLVGAFGGEATTQASSRPAAADVAPNVAPVLDAENCTAKFVYDSGESVLAYHFREKVVTYDTLDAPTTRTPFSELGDEEMRQVKRLAKRLPPACSEGL